MFERFTEGARQAVVAAQEEARSLHHGWVGTEHLLLGVLRAGSPVAAVLAAQGLTHERVRDAVEAMTKTPADEAAVLRDLGIDVEEVRRRVEASFGPGALDAPPPGRERRPFRRRRAGGHIPFTAEGKKALELALREALQLRSGEINEAHIVLGVLRGGGTAAAVMSRLGFQAGAVRRAVLDQMGRAA